MDNKKSKIFNFLRVRASRSLFMRILYNIYSQMILGIDLDYRTQIGNGFCLYHSGHGSVVSVGTVIGNNVSLRQNTTIGAKGFEGAKDSPIIEDDVVIGPNVCIIGAIKIGRGAVIGAGAVVVRDVPPRAVVAGNPAKVIGERE